MKKIGVGGYAGSVVPHKIIDSGVVIWRAQQFQAPTEQPEVPLVSKRRGWVIEY